MPNVQHSISHSDEQDARWRAVIARDSEADGHFVYCVRTTGIYCRPSCPARRARRENIVFAENADAAERAGFRPCKRCHPEGLGPLDQQRDKIVTICRVLERADEPPDLDALARQAGLSRFHFHRLFKFATGVTPKAYAQACRKMRLRGELAKPDTNVTSAIYNAGFGSSGRFYEGAKAMLGMTATEYRAGGARKTLRFAVTESSLGPLLVACSESGVCAILFGDDRASLIDDLRQLFPRAELIDDAGFSNVIAKVTALVEMPGLGLDLPLDIVGTAFQQRVWQALREVPAGTTVSYTDIARRIGAPKSARAVAQACGANKIVVAIPCHRIIHHDGGLSGYTGGIARKRALLEREGVDLSARKKRSKEKQDNKE
jgi:AraC family transcriptional regulator of adaptative response/methylated-DNA-[protein]-cysteine methyltransferase